MRSINLATRPPTGKVSDPIVRLHVSGTFLTIAGTPSEIEYVRKALKMYDFELTTKENK